MSGINNFPKNIFLSQFKIVLTFFVRSAAGISEYNFLCLKFGETLLSGTNNFAKKYFLSTI